MNTGMKAPSRSVERRSAHGRTASQPTLDTGGRVDRRGFLSQAECQDIMDRLTRFAVGGGDTTAIMASTWTGMSAGPVIKSVRRVTCAAITWWSSAISRARRVQW